MRSTRIPIWSLLLGAALAACPDDPPSDPPDAGGPPTADSGVVPERDGGIPERQLMPLVDVCPRGDNLPVIGDSNADGVMDIADAIALQNYRFRGGRAPSCRAAANFDGDGVVEMDDAERISMHLLTGEQNPRRLGEHECDSATPWPEGQCAPLAIDLLAPLRVTTDRFQVQLAMRSPTLAVQGYSLSLDAGDCEVSKISFENSVAAEVWDTPPGLRHLGWSTALPVQGGAIAYLILSFTDDIYFPNTTDPTPILSAEVRAVPPPQGCRTCRVSVLDGLSWRGQPINTTFAADGRAYVPALPNIEVQVCAE